MAVIYAFGDSITYGAWGIQTGGWATRMRAYLDQLQEHHADYYAVFYNLGIPGETTNGLVKRFESEVEARNRDGEESIFIFAYGANDSVELEDGSHRVILAKYIDNMGRIISQAKKMSSKILLINTTPVVESKNKNRNGKTRTNDTIRHYNLIVNQLGTQAGIKVVDAYGAFEAHGVETLMTPDDGLHPNDEGHKILFDLVRPVVIEMLGWKAS